MPADWVTNRVHAGHDLADRLTKIENPIFAAVEIGTAAGSLAAKIFAASGEVAAKKFMAAFIACFNQETIAADPSQRNFHLRSE